MTWDLKCASCGVIFTRRYCDRCPKCGWKPGTLAVSR